MTNYVTSKKTKKECNSSPQIDESFLILEGHKFKQYCLLAFAKAFEEEAC